MGIAANVGARFKPTFEHTAPRPFDSSEFHRLLTVRTLCELRTVMVLEGMISLEKTALQAVAPIEVFRTVWERTSRDVLFPPRPPNAELRTPRAPDARRGRGPDLGRQEEPARSPGRH